MTDALFLSPDVSVAAVGDVIELSGDEGRHAAVVKRIRVGETLLLSDGLGRAVRGVTTAVAKSSITCEVTELIEPVDAPHEWVAVQALANTACAPTSATLSGRTAFTVACVPTTINAGVSISPWGVWMTPVRPSRPSSWWVTSNEKLIGPPTLAVGQWQCRQQSTCAGLHR